jgi:hypothetical protein
MSIPAAQTTTTEDKMAIPFLFISIPYQSFSAAMIADSSGFAVKNKQIFVKNEQKP